VRQHRLGGPKGALVEIVRRVHRKVGKQRGDFVLIAGRSCGFGNDGSGGGRRYWHDAAREICMGTDGRGPRARPPFPAALPPPPPVGLSPDTATSRRARGLRIARHYLTRIACRDWIWVVLQRRHQAARRSETRPISHQGRGAAATCGKKVQAPPPDPA